MFATNGEDTVDVIKKTQPDIVLLDIIMPQIDGLTVMQRIRRIMIVLILHLLLLVQLERGSDRGCFNMGATYYVMKPFDNNMLIDRIKYIEELLI